MCRFTLASLLVLVSVLSASQPRALMIDFGPSAASQGATGPLHSADFDFFGDHWVRVGNRDLSTDIVYADGTPARGVELDLGTSVDAPTLQQTVAQLLTIDLDRQPNGNAPLGQETGRGVYAEGEVARDGVFFESARSNGKFKVGSVGLQVRGLEPGFYELHVVGRNTNLTYDPGDEERIVVHAGPGVPGRGFDAGGPGYTFGGNTFIGPNDQTDRWTEGGNYVRLLVTLREGEALNLAVSGAGTTGGGTLADERGFLNALQIVRIGP